MSGCHGLYGLAALHSGKSRQNALNEYQGRSLSAPLLITGACVTCSQVGFVIYDMYMYIYIYMIWAWGLECSRPLRHTKAADGVSHLFTSAVTKLRQTARRGKLGNKSLWLSADIQDPRSVCVCVWDGLMFSSSTWYTVPSALLTVWTGSVATFLSVWDI